MNTAEKSQNLAEYFKKHEALFLLSNKRLTNMLLNEYERTLGITNLKSFPRDLKITLTNICNLNCIMCHQQNAPAWQINETQKNEIIKFLPYAERVAWLGGEIFLSKYYKELLETAAKYGVYQEITTNGTLIDKNIADFLIRNNVNITFSVDSLNEEVYPEIRRGGTLQKALNGLRNVCESKKKYNKTSFVALNVVISALNYNEISAFVRFAKEHALDYLVLTVDGDYLNNFDKIKNTPSNIMPVLNGLSNNVREAVALAENLGVNLRYDLPLTENEND